MTPSRTSGIGGRAFSMSLQIGKALCLGIGDTQTSKHLFPQAPLLCAPFPASSSLSP